MIYLLTLPPTKNMCAICWSNDVDKAEISLWTAGGAMWSLPLLSPLVLVLVLLVVLCRYLRSRSRMVRLINRIPGPPYLPIIGNAIEMNVEHDGMAPDFNLISLHLQFTHLCGGPVVYMLCYYTRCIATSRRYVYFCWTLSIVTTYSISVVQWFACYVNMNIASRLRENTFSSVCQ
jgi:hypothetical protein